MICTLYSYTAHLHLGANIKSQVWYSQRQCVSFVLHFPFHQKLSLKVVFFLYFCKNIFLLWQKTCLIHLILPTFEKKQAVGAPTWEKFSTSWTSHGSQVGDVLFALKQLWDGGSRCILRRLAYSIRRLGRLGRLGRFSATLQHPPLTSLASKGWECRVPFKTLRVVGQVQFWFEARRSFWGA